LGISIAVTVLLGLSAGAFAVAELSAMAKPRDYDARVAAADEKAHRLQRVLRANAPNGPFGWDAICRQPPAREVQQLRKDITAQAEAAKLTLASLEVGPDYQASLGETLSPLRVRLEAEGGYEGALGLLAGLAEAKPSLFIDTLDLSSRTSSVSLKLSGRVYCSAGI
jgi:hypothetical protein